jgi:hypothetical protein
LCPSREGARGVSVSFLLYRLIQGMGNCRGGNAICSREWLTAPPLVLLPSAVAARGGRPSGIRSSAGGLGRQARTSPTTLVPPKKNRALLASQPPPSLVPSMPSLLALPLTGGGASLSATRCHPASGLALRALCLIPSALCSLCSLCFQVIPFNSGPLFALKLRIHCGGGVLFEREGFVPDLFALKLRIQCGGGEFS